MNTDDLLSKLSDAILVTLKIKSRGSQKKTKAANKTAARKPRKRPGAARKAKKKPTGKKKQPEIKVTVTPKQESVLPIKRIAVKKEDTKPAKTSSNMPAPWSKVQKYKRIKKDYYNRY